MLRYAITDRRAGLREGEAESAATDRMVERCAHLARDGVDFVLVREKDLPAAELVALSRRVVEATCVPGTRTQVLVAGRADIAYAAGADGVHLSSAPGELRPEQVRQVLPGAFVTVSCHSVEDVRRAYADGASLALFAPVFGKWVAGVEVLRGVGPGGLRAACEAGCGMPVLALGGVSSANTGECLRAGAAGVAGIRMFFAEAV